MSEIKVVIEWERMEPWKKVLDKQDEENDYGVYQISGYHAVFGDNSLLYIGMAQEQTFGTRFGQHKDWLEKEYDIKVYIGRVDSIDDNKDYHTKSWDSIIGDIEALLVYFHSPPYNSTYISNEPKPNRDLRIINIGDYGNLYSELSHEGLRLDSKPQRPSDG